MTSRYTFTLADGFVPDPAGLWTKKIVVDFPAAMQGTGRAITVYYLADEPQDVLLTPATVVTEV